MSISAFTKRFYLSRFFFDFVLIYAVEKIYFKYQGLTLSEIGLLLFLWSLLTVIFEVPTGALADKWSRRKMLILSGIFFAICYLVWIFSTSWPLFLLGFVFRTLGSTFSSGTLLAYTYDFFKSSGSEHMFAKAWSRGEALRLIGTSCAVLIGGYLSTHSYSWTLVISALMVSIPALVAISWPELTKFRSTEEIHYRKYISLALHEFTQNKSILKISLFMIFVPSVIGNLEEYYDLIFKGEDFSNTLIGVLIAIVLVLQSIGSALAYKLPNSWNTYRASALAIIALLLVASFGSSLVLVLCIIIITFIHGFSSVMADSHLQSHLDSLTRATTTSVSALMLNLIPTGLAIGIIADHYSLSNSLIFCAIIASLYFLSDLFIKANPVPELR